MYITKNLHSSRKHLPCFFPLEFFIWTFLFILCLCREVAEDSPDYDEYYDEESWEPCSLPPTCQSTLFLYVQKKVFYKRATDEESSWLVSNKWVCISLKQISQNVHVHKKSIGIFTAPFFCLCQNCKRSGMKYENWVKLGCQWQKHWVQFGCLGHQIEWNLVIEESNCKSWKSENLTAMD